MAFNVQVTPIGDNQPSKTSRDTVEIVKLQTLVNMPADKNINKYPVRIFDLQPQRS
jgi:hypothetical protein